MMISKETFKVGMRRLASGVSIITTAHEGQWHGFAATAVSSVSAEPPSLLVCVNKAVSSHDVFVKSGRFCVNLLGHAGKPLAQAFGSPLDRDKRFAGDGWAAGQSGVPLLSSALAAFECRISLSMSIHTHSLLIGEIEALHLNGERIDPLLYVNGDYHDVGPAL